MFAIVGAAGKVGFATSQALREAGKPVRAILRDTSKAAKLREIGCEISVADLQDPKALVKAIGSADTVQVILPPAPQLKDAAEQMRQAIESLATALEEARPQCVLAVSDYGAHITDDIGMPTMCRDFETRLSKVPGKKVFLRSAEHMQGWGRAVPAAKESGILPSFHDPVDMLFPTISAPDLGFIAANILLRPAAAEDVEIIHAEGPRRYSANDAAATLSELLGKTIRVEAVPRSQWKEKFERVMSPTLAELLIKANEAQNKGGVVDVESGHSTVYYGKTELIDALRPLV
ncbi:NAD(P)H azoreductase [Trichoderma asperellum]|uniref:NAD(P)H azoreductase n=1 Tax=Trichoderma asperellum TaxID=101201 RepID=A0A6V8R4L7_TRIAP|nr:NAD(P)H azoreductase [Trichoderma asperellum]